MALLDTDALESLLVEADRLAVALHGDNDDKGGLIDEIRDCVKCMEDAIDQLGGAYEAENEAAKRLTEAKEAIANVTELVDSALVESIKKIEPTIESEVRCAIKHESKNIVDNLTNALKNELFESDIKQKITQQIDAKIAYLVDNKVMQSISSKEKNSNEDNSKERFWRKYGYVILPLAIFGFICLLLFSSLIISGSISNISIQNGNLIMEL